MILVLSNKLEVFSCKSTDGLGKNSSPEIKANSSSLVVSCLKSTVSLWSSSLKDWVKLKLNSNCWSTSSSNWFFVENFCSILFESSSVISFISSVVLSELLYLTLPVTELLSAIKYSVPNKMLKFFVLYYKLYLQLKKDFVQFQDSNIHFENERYLVHHYSYILLL